MKTRTVAFNMFMALGLAASLGIGASATHEPDERIESGIKGTFVFRQYLKDDNFKVKSKDGAVTLLGTVSEDYKKSLAYDAAISHPGVKSVDNQLWVKSSGAGDGSDAWLTGKVKTALLFHRSVSGLNTDVDAKDGVVTLRGRADTQAQKDLTTEYARDIEGVKEVRNELTVSHEPGRARGLDDKIDDSSITAQAKLALLFHRSTSGFKIHVETKNEVVTLSGKAKNTAEKDLAEKIVKDVRGVRSVRNLIVVD